jgi:hypothetical protein
MKQLLSFQKIVACVTITLFSIIIFSSCAKQKELEQLGCTEGKRFFSDSWHVVGPMTKDEFITYLDSPKAKYQGEVLQFQLKWTPIESAGECVIGK